MSKKAERATIQIGDITMNVYMMPNGDYRLHGRGVMEVIGVTSKQSLPRFYGVQSLKALPGADLSLPHGTIRSSTGEDFIPVALEDAINYWMEVGKKGNDKALRLVAALAVESLERRADKVFGRERSEEERNQRLAWRTRNRFEFHQVLTASMQRNIGNIQCWGCYIKQFQDRLGIESGSRDELDAKTQMLLAVSQQVVAKLLDAGIQWETALNMLNVS